MAWQAERQAAALQMLLTLCMQSSQRFSAAAICGMVLLASAIEHCVVREGGTCSLQQPQCANHMPIICQLYALHAVPSWHSTV
jgi:hypothetical protein